MYGARSPVRPCASCTVATPYFASCFDTSASGRGISRTQTCLLIFSLSSDRKLEHAPRIALEEGFLVGVGNGHGVAGVDFLGMVLVGVVHRVHHALHAQHLLAELDGRLPGHAAAGHED